MSAQETSINLLQLSTFVGFLTTQSWPHRFLGVYLNDCGAIYFVATAVGVKALWPAVLEISREANMGRYNVPNTLTDMYFRFDNMVWRRSGSISVGRDPDGRFERAKRVNSTGTLPASDIIVVIMAK
jgi:hypothetical protein